MAYKFKKKFLISLELEAKTESDMEALVTTLGLSLMGWMGYHKKNRGKTTKVHFKMLVTEDMKQPNDK